MAHGKLTFEAAWANSAMPAAPCLCLTVKTESCLRLVDQNGPNKSLQAMPETLEVAQAKSIP